MRLIETDQVPINRVQGAREFRKKLVIDDPDATTRKLCEPGGPFTTVIGTVRSASHRRNSKAQIGFMEAGATIRTRPSSGPR
jgi:hypothetical protein